MKSATNLCQAILIASVCVSSTQIRAQVLRDYRCKIERLARADTPHIDVAKMTDTHYVGKEFAVYRRTGIMSGALKNSFITRPEVVDFGSDQNSFKAVTMLRQGQGLGPGSNVYVLVVEEFVKEASKPFVFLENTQIYFGSCVYF